jgi:hypothetical protein
VVEAASNTSLQEYYRNRESEILESVADKTAQREAVSKYLLQMKYSSPGNTPFAERVIYYCPGNRPHRHSPHPFVVISKELRDPIMEDRLGYLYILFTRVYLCYDLLTTKSFSSSISFFFCLWFGHNDHSISIGGRAFI